MVALSKFFGTVLGGGWLPTQTRLQTCPIAEGGLLHVSLTASCPPADRAALYHSELLRGNAYAVTLVAAQLSRPPQSHERPCCLRHTVSEVSELLPTVTACSSLRCCCDAKQHQSMPIQFSFFRLQLHDARFLLNYVDHGDLHWLLLAQPLGFGRKWKITFPNIFISEIVWVD